MDLSSKEKSLIIKLEKDLFGNLAKKENTRFNLHKKLLNLWFEEEQKEFEGKIRKGMILWFWYKTEYYKYGGYESFRDFCQSQELGLKFGYIQATQYVNVVEKIIIEFGISPERIMEKCKNWTQLVNLNQALQDGTVTKQNFFETVEELSELPAPDVRMRIKELRGKVEDDETCNHSKLQIAICSSCETRFSKRSVTLQDGEKWETIPIRKI